MKYRSRSAACFFAQLALPFFLYTSSLSAAPYLWETNAMEMDWVAMSVPEQQDGDLMWRKVGRLVAGSKKRENPATASLAIPQDGTYVVWVLHQVNAVRRKTFTIHLGDKELIFCPLPYGKTAEERPEIYKIGELGEKGMLWTFQKVALEAGDYTLKLSTKVIGDEPKGGAHPPVVSQILITDDPNYMPQLP